MKVGFIIYQGMNLLEFSLLYDPITRIKTMGFDQNLKWDLISYTLMGSDDRGLELKPTKVGGVLREYDILLIPGGDSTRTLSADEGFIYWLSSGAQAPVRCASGTGVLLFGMSGLFLDAQVAAQPGLHTQLQKVCRAPVDLPFLADQNCLTCQSGLHALNLSAYLVERMQGENVRDLIFKRIAGEYSANGILIPGI